MRLFMSGLVHPAKHLLGSSMYAEIFSSLAVPHLFAYSPVDGLKMLLFPAVTKDAAVNVHRKSYCGCVFPVLWDRYLGEEEGHDLVSLGFTF